MTAIMMKELRTYFIQMTGYIFLALTVLLTALFFVSVNVRFASPHFHLVLNQITILFLVMIPTLTMRLFADEVKNRTDQLLYTSPIAIWQIVLGKYLAAGLLFMGAMVVTMLFPFMLSMFGELPMSQIIGAYVGYILMGLKFIAIGLFISVMTENQIIAAVATFGAIFFTFILDGLAGGMPADTTSSLIFIGALILILAGIFYNSTKNIIAPVILTAVGAGVTSALFFSNRMMFDGIIGRTFRWISVFSRYDNLTRGILNISDIIFSVTFALLFVYLTINAIEKRRWR